MSALALRSYTPVMSLPWFTMLASADASDPNANNLLVLVLSVGLILGIIVLALVPIVRTRRHRHGDIIRVLTFFWGVAAAYIAFKTTTQQLDWSAERVSRLESGYYSQAQVDQGAPGWPILSISAIALGYGGLVVWSFLPLLPVAAMATPSKAMEKPVPSTNPSPPADA